MKLLRVVRPDGRVIAEAEPAINMEFALWNAKPYDIWLDVHVLRNGTRNVQQAKRKGYTFQEVQP